MSEREVEVPWAVEHTRGPVLDVGCAESNYIDLLDGPVDGIDVRPNLVQGLRNQYLGDIRTWHSPHLYKTVLAVSTIEHIGLKCDPYGTEADDLQGDVRAVEGCVRACAPGGQVLITVPYGKQAKHRGWYRVYDDDGLESLLHGYKWTAQYVINRNWAVGGVALITLRVGLS